MKKGSEECHHHGINNLGRCELQHPHSIQFNNNKESDSLCLTWRLLANTGAVPLVDLCKEQIKSHVRALKKAIEVSLLIPVLPSPSIKSYTHMKGSHRDTYEPITKECHLHFLPCRWGKLALPWLHTEAISAPLDLSNDSLALHYPLPLLFTAACWFS